MITSANSRGIGMTSMRTRERLIQKIRDEGVTTERVLQAMLDVPRHLFVDEALASRAYENNALPIGHGQTISQPLTVARMTEVLISSGDVNKVLEIGTGSGYQAAVLAKVVDQVFTIERIHALVARARNILRELKLGNVHVRHGDGGTGWRQYGPYDGILMAAAATEVPQALLEQLRVGGKLVAPVGRGHEQELIMIERTESGWDRQVIDTARFVPLRGGIS